MNELTRLGTMEITNEIPYFEPPKEILSKKEIDLKRKYKYKTPTQTYTNYIY